MRKIILLFALLLVASCLFAQNSLKLGMVKGKNVTYQVRERKGKNYEWVVRNVHNPDTVIKPIPQRSVMTTQEEDIEMQIAEIIHDHLSQEELSQLDSANESFSLILRASENKLTLLQVTCFIFTNDSVYAKKFTPEEARLRGLPESYDNFWLNFDPDRLHEIEMDIVKRVVLPPMHESYLTDDIWAVVGSWRICDMEATRAAREEAIRRWKKNPDPTSFEMMYLGPPVEI